MYLDQFTNVHNLQIRGNHHKTNINYTGSARGVRVIYISSQVCV